MRPLRDVESDEDKAVVRRFATRMLEMWKRDIGPHFDAEEKHLVPPFAERAGAHDSDLERLRDDHRRLRRDMAALRDAKPRGSIAARNVLVAIAERLDEHIRFEERVLFPRMETTLSRNELTRAARAFETMLPDAKGDPIAGATKT